MPPQRGRKRPADSRDSPDGLRPSPHRPEDSHLAQQGRHYNQHHNQGSPYQGQRGGRGRGRGDRGRDQARNGRHSFGNPGNDNQSDRRPPRDEPASAETPKDAPTPQPAALARPPQASTPATPQPQQQQAAPPQPPPKPRDPPGPYLYELLTDDIVETWADTGRSSAVQTIAQRIRDENYLETCNAFQEVLRAGLDGKLGAADAGCLIKDTLASVPDDKLDASILFLDTLSILAEFDSTHPNLKTLVLSTEISAQSMRETLDDPILQTLGLVRSNFGKIFIRKQTNVLYRQSNYNLLREESEGYSKLMTELFTTVMSSELTGDVVQQTFEQTKALIGAFDLDAGRVLDVTLDIFASLLVKQFRFFVKYLRTSSFWPQEHLQDGLHLETPPFETLPPWAQLGHLEWFTSEEDKEDLARLKLERDIQFWNRARAIGTDAFFELGGRRVINTDELAEHTTDSKQPEDSRAVETRKWIVETKTLPPSGSQVAAQLLGFKLRFYASTARDATDNLPDNLIYLAALLIKIGFISLRDLYAHLYPDDDAMEAVKEKKTKEQQEREQAKRGGGAMNALMKAGALADDGPPPTMSRLRATDKGAATPSKSEVTSEAAGATEEESDPLPEPVDQKIELLKSLLCIGAIPEALYLLGRFPWLYDLVPDLPRYFHRILHHSLSKICKSLSPLPNRPSVKDGLAPPSEDQVGMPKGDVRLDTPKARKSLRWAKIDSNDVDGNADYRFYWDDWADNVPVCRSIDDVFTLCDTLLNFSGVKIGLDTALLSKLARLGKESLSQDPSLANETRWVTLCKRLLCPALSMTKANPGASNDLYELLRLLSTYTRYSIYSEWFQGPTSRTPDVAVAFAVVRKETSDLVKRMSKTNMKQMAQALAKITHASPGVVFEHVLKSIESYPNLIEVVVECGRYFTYMAYDVLTWAILVALGKTGRERVGATGYEATKWLVALSAFTGKIFKRYTPMNTAPVLQYLLEQLRQENFTDLRVLRELITNMAGIVPDTNFSDAQVQAMSGGRLLQSQILQQIHDSRHESIRSGKRLAKSFVDNGLVGPFLVSIALTRQLCIDKPKHTNLKIISENFDDVHIGFVQYLDMLFTNLGVAEFESLVPDVVSLIADRGVDPSIAFAVHRRGITKAMTEFDAAHPAETKPRRRSSSDHKSNSGDVEMSDAADLVGDANADTVLDRDVTKLENEDVQDAAAGDKSVPIATLSEGSQMPWHPVLENIMERLRPHLGEEFESAMSLPFFTTFWQLSLQDIMAPSASYEEETKKFRDRLSAIDKDKTIGYTAKQREEDRKPINEMLAAMTNEMKHHVINYQVVRRRLIKEKSFWFKNYRNFKQLNAALLQECFLPRLLLSPLDAFYSQKMVWFLHSSGAPGFSTMHLIEALFSKNALANLIFQCTAKEAVNLGRFVNEILRPLSVWHGDKDAYERHAYGSKRDLPGFAMGLADGKPSNFLDHVSFRKLMYKWHQNIFHVLDNCIKFRGEYMHVKNAISFLNQVIPHFPKVNWMNERLEKRAALIAEDEAPSSESNAAKGLERNDIWVAAKSLQGQLIRAKKDTIMVQAFRDGADDTPADLKTNGSLVKPALTADGSKKSLNANAKDFNPPTGPSVEPLQVPSISGRQGKDVEDGELADSPKVSRPDSQQDILKQKALASVESRRRETQDVTKLDSTDSSHPRPTLTDGDAADDKPVAHSLRSDVRSGRSTPSSRQSHALPDRPEFSSSRSRPPTGPPTRGSGTLEDRSDPRNRYGPEAGRLDRPRDLPMERERRGVSPGRLAGPVDRMGPPAEHYRERPYDRSSRPYLDESGRRPPRDIRESPREPLVENPYPGERNQRFDERQPRSDMRGHPEYSRDTRDMGPPQQSDLSGVNPARAARIAGDSEQSMAPEQFRRGTDPYAAPRSRPDSPGRGDGRMPPRSDMRDERLVSSRPPPYDARYPPDYPPNGPRDVVRGPPRGAYGDESRAGGPMVLPRDTRYPQDFSGPDHRRVPRHQQDPNYGRLSAEPSMPPSPTGPRSQRPNQGNFPPPMADRRQSAGPSASAQDAGLHNRMAPPPRTSDRFQQAQPSAPSSATSTPTPQLQSTGNGDTSGVHPSRLGQLPIPSQQPAAITPSGPRSAQLQTPTGTPTGPSSASTAAAAAPDRRRSGAPGDTRRMQGLQDTLQQTSAPTFGPGDRNGGSNQDQGAAIRGRAGPPEAAYGRGGPPPQQLHPDDRRRGERELGPPVEHRPRRDLMAEGPLGARDARGYREREPRGGDGYDSGRDRRGRDAREGGARGDEQQRRVSGRKREWEGEQGGGDGGSADKRLRRGQ
ncbi:hypothetical protein FH972_023652 [Carpinus fangiana]|uniref:THO complex subunit 2 n=1 Tax=Carpinus fangiana TaxID=176857 RepID=A0A5N6KWF3_9ROSI|nr:hypothetical protein FH972_023652 [Carpinus fangiana]